MPQHRAGARQPGSRPRRCQQRRHATAGTSEPELAVPRSARLPARRQAVRSGRWTACGASRPPGSGRLRDCGRARSKTPRARTLLPAASCSGPRSLPGRHGCTIEATNQPPGRSAVVTVDRAPAGAGRHRGALLGIDEAAGKPAPDVYLAAARGLGESPARCLAIEDSPNGVRAAKAAGMRCLAIPDPLLAADARYREADLVLSSLTCLDDGASHVLRLPRAC